MRTLVVVSQKGGVGKTTLAGHLGVMAVMNKNGPVALIDTQQFPVKLLQPIEYYGLKNLLHQILANKTLINQ